MTDIIQSLSKVSDLWLDPKNALREETIQALQVSTGFSRRQIELALTNCFEELTRAKITAYVSSFAQGKRTNIDDFGAWHPVRLNRRGVLHVLPSNVFTAWVHGTVITLLFGYRCLLKSSTREPVFARAWKQSLEQIDSSLSEQVEVVSWDDAMVQASTVVVAYGSDETLQKIKAKLPPSVRFVGYGHKLSAGIIFKEALKEFSREELLSRVRADAEPFRLQGCLSPQILYIEDVEFGSWPELKASVDVSPKIKAFQDWSEVLSQLDKFQPYLSCVGYLGASNKKAFLEKELKSHDGLRICLLGEMQRPPLSWKNGGIDLKDLLNSIPQKA